MREIFETRNDLFKSFDKNLTIVELGVFKGDFSKEVYEITKPKKLYLVDMFEGYFGSGDKDGKNHINVQLEEELIKLKDYFKNNNNVEIIKSTTIDFLNSLEDESLDIVYIDADHSYQAVKNDLIHSYKKIKKGGFICGHDLVPNSDVEKAVVEFCLEFSLGINAITKDGCPSFSIIK